MHKPDVGVTSRLLATFLCLIVICFHGVACDKSNPVGNEGDTPPPVDDPIRIDTNFEGSNLASWVISDEDEVSVSIRPDTNAPDYRWYSFRVTGGQRKRVTFRITNAGDSNASAAWSYNRPVVSVDNGATWERISHTLFTGSVFSFEYALGSASAWIVYQPVYNFSRWLNLADELSTHPSVESLKVIGQSLEGNPVHLVKVTDASVPDDQKAAIWIVARQHPAEVGGSWMAEGLLRWALGNSEDARAFRKVGVLYMIPFLNPDGVLHGNYRMNTAGLNLNRRWDGPGNSTEPTIAAAETVIERYRDEGGETTLFADFHAHSTYRKNFFYYHDIALTDPGLSAEMTAFMRELYRLNPDFTVDDSETGSPGSPILAWNWAYYALGTSAVTFEASYQDVYYGPNAGNYMTVERYLALGEAFGRAAAKNFYLAE